MEQEAWVRAFTSGRKRATRARISASFDGTGVRVVADPPTSGPRLAFVKTAARVFVKHSSAAIEIQIRRLVLFSCQTVGSRRKAAPFSLCSQDSLSDLNNVFNYKY